MAPILQFKFILNWHCEKDENVLQSLYTYFFHNPKKTQNFVDLVDIVVTVG
jgi:hypothetical protein